VRRGRAQYGWDDYKGLDVRKTIVMLVNDPAVPIPTTVEAG
jgi:hypothetical protein